MSDDTTTPTTLAVGTAEAAPGELARGHLTVTDLPTGGTEDLPVLVANGTADGPRLWLTGAVHGDEVTGLAAVQDALDERLPERLTGQVVAVPAVNPAGLRRTERTSYYGGDDPNRYFPDPEVDAEDRVRPPRVQERIDRRLYEAFTETAPADALLDLHTAQIGSAPFVIRDRVLYGTVRDEAAAEALSEALGALAAALEVPVVREYEPAEYVDQSLQRSTAGAALNNAGIPALTLELGTHGVVDERQRALGVAAVYRAMVHLGLLDDVPGWAPDRSASGPVSYPVRRAVHPHTDTAGLVRHRVEPGDVLEAGDTVAEVVAPTGEERATVATEHDGYVLGRSEGVAAYEGDALASLAVRDDGALVAPRDPDDEAEDEDEEGEDDEEDATRSEGR